MSTFKKVFFIFNVFRVIQNLHIETVVELIILCLNISREAALLL